VIRTLVVIAAGAIALAPGGATARAAGDADVEATGQAQGAATAALTLRSTRYGRVLFDGRGRVLYAFTRDRRGGPSRCYGACAAAWPVYFAKSSLRAGSGVKQSLIGKTRRRNGRMQVTYNGWPLYYYAHEGPGEVKCQNVDQFGGLWLVVKPNGTLVR
jgi:predicted lipoprotein with Yx(FWY)xxD motif